MRRPRRDDGTAAEGLVLVDATSAAGGLRVEAGEFDAYYFAPQKCFGSEGGLWLALLSPAALKRVERLSTTGRFVPAFLDLKIRSPTPACNRRTTHRLWPPCSCSPSRWTGSSATVASSGQRRQERSSEIVYGWAERSSFARPFVADEAERSRVTATIDFDESLDALKVASILRSNGVVDTEPYRKLGRNQLRIAMFPAIEPTDLEALTACVDWVVERLEPAS